MYDTITNHNDRNHTQLYNAKITEAIDQVILEEQTEANNATVDLFSSQKNKSKNLILKVTYLTINNVGENMIDNVADLTINDVGNNSNRVTESYVQVQLAGDSTRISHQNLWSRRIIGIRYEEVPMLITHVIPSIIANN